MVTSFKFRVLSLFSMPKSILTRLYINMLHFDCAMICMMYLLALSTNLSIYKYFDSECPYL